MVTARSFLVASLFAVALAPALAVTTFSTAASADVASERSAIVDSLTKLSGSASVLARAAKTSADRAARRKFSVAASDLADELAGLAARTSKGVAMKTLAKDAASAEHEANALVVLADDVEDKDDRKSFRAQAVLLGQGITAAKKSMEAAVSSEDKAATARPVQYTGRLANTSNGNRCGISENVRFAVTREGRTYFTSQLVFPGREQPLVLENGRYHVQILDTVGKRLASRDVVVDREGWALETGCFDTN